MDWSGLLVGAVTTILGFAGGWILSSQNDRRSRWWEMLMFLWDHHGRMPLQTQETLFDALNDLSRTKEQSAMLEAVMDATLTQGGQP